MSACFRVPSVRNFRLDLPRNRNQNYLDCLLILAVAMQTDQVRERRNGRRATGSDLVV